MPTAESETINPDKPFVYNDLSAYAAPAPATGLAHGTQNLTIPVNAISHKVTTRQMTPSGYRIPAST